MKILLRTPIILSIIGGIIGFIASVNVGANAIGLSTIISSEGIPHNAGRIVGIIARNIVDRNVIFLLGLIASILSFIF